MKSMYQIDSNPSSPKRKLVYAIVALITIVVAAIGVATVTLLIKAFAQIESSVGNSPRPFAPIGVRGDSVSSVSRVKVGVVLALGKV